MPSVSQRQHNFMAMIAHDKAKAKEKGVPQSVARDYAREDAKRADKAKKRYGGKRGR